MRTSDWSSDVCSSDLARGRRSSGHSSCNACRTGKTAGTKHPHAEEEVGSDVELGGKGGCNPVTAQSGVVSWPSPTRMVLYGPILRPGGKGRNLRAMWAAGRSEEHTSELQSLMRISYAVFCLKKQKSTKDKILKQIHTTPLEHKHTTN